MLEGGVLVIVRFAQRTKNRYSKPPQMNYSKKNIFSRIFYIPVIKFEDQHLTSFAGLVIYQPLLQDLNLKERLKKYFDHLKVFEIFGHHVITLLFIFHL
jgi:hypothetical protein